MPPASLAKLVLRLPTTTQLGREANSSHRFVLTAIAVHADKHGAATVGLAELSRYTDLSPTLIRKAIRSAEANGYITVEANPYGPNTYRFNTARLRDLNSAYVRAGEDRIYVLTDFGVSDRTLHALARSGYDTLTALGQAITDYRALPPEFQVGLHVHLNARMVGKTGGDSVLAAYDELRKIEGLRDYYDNNDTSADMEEGEWIDPRQRS